MTDFFEKYRANIKKLYHQGDYSEYTFRKDFQEFIEKLFNKGGYNFDIIHEPSKREEGIPDFRIMDGFSLIGYIETKRPDRELDKDLSSLTDKEKESIKRYIDASKNVILTNYKQFVYLKSNKKSTRKVIKLLNSDFEINEKEKFIEIITIFSAKSTPFIKKSKKLAEYLAKFTKVLKDSIYDLMRSDEDQYLNGYYQIFQKYLLSKINKEDFSDAMAQTITYGLFMAKLNLNIVIKRENVLLKGIPSNLKLISRLFYYLIGTDLAKQLEWIIDDIINILNNSDWDSIKNEFHYTKGIKDPFIHFYETFLAQYNPYLRKKRGVYYTPSEVVTFIINSIEKVLEQKFNTNLLDFERVVILDPATGTGTFLSSIIQKIYNQVGKDLFPDYLKAHILKNFYGFEILISPYIISHLRLSQVVQDLGGTMPQEKRFKIYLTNTLNILRGKEQVNLPLESLMQKESEQADKIKRESEIFVILGNPPYESKTQDVYIEELVKQDYLVGLGVENEKKKGVMQDDYVKFIKFAQWKIEEHTKKGIIGFITNNSFLDGIIHRKMRKSLMESFDEIYILNLHGNIRRGEQDENVFDIQQGVAISIFVKLNEGKHNYEDCKVYYYSSLENNLIQREEKNEFLKDNDVLSINWEELQIADFERQLNQTRWYDYLKEKFETEIFGFYFFIKKDLSDVLEYGNAYGLEEIFIKSSSAIETQKDYIAVSFSPEEAINKINDFTTLPQNEVRKKYNIKDTRDWKLKNVIKDLLKDKVSLKNRSKSFEIERIKPIAYRPFDIRYTYFFDKSRSFVAYPKYDIMNHFVLGDNLGLSVTRQVNSKFTHAFITDRISERCLLSTQSKELAYIFPLYLYKITRKNDKLVLKKTHNIKEDYRTLVTNKYGKITVEDLMHFIYGVLYSNKYKDQFQEFLRFDFPRIPLYEKDKFEEYTELGKKLIRLHLMKDKISVVLKVQGTDREIKQIKYKNGKLFISKETYLEISEDIWNYPIAGFNVIEKYLNYRKGKTLNLQNLNYLFIIAEIIKRTKDLCENM